MNIDKMREEFEAWAWKKFGDVFWYGLDRAHVFMRSGDQYHTEFLNIRLEAWQASRESLVVELPDDGIEDCRKEWPGRGEKYEYDTFDTGYLFACMKHEQAIESLGLRVKP